MSKYRYGVALARRKVFRSSLVRDICGERHAQVRLRVRQVECGPTAGETLVVGFGDGRCVFGELGVVLVLVLGPL